MYGGYYQSPEGLLVRLTTSPADRPFPLPAFEGPAATPREPLRPEDRNILVDYWRALDRRIRVDEAAGRAEDVAALKALKGRLPL
jgi:hypothetical protein